MGNSKPVHGMFSNSMAFGRWGQGRRTVLLIPGGPGNEIPRGLGLRMMLSQYSPLLRDGFTVWMVTRKQNMPANYTIGDMAHDYATLINAEFDRSVDVVLGTSFGGLVAQYLAADHPGCFLHLVVASTGWTVSEEGKTLEQDYANSLSEGKRWKAATILMNGMFPNLPYRWMARIGGALFAPMVSGGHEYFAHDVVVEAEAEMGFDGRAVLPRITVPVLLIAGDKDFYFPRHIVEETARLIPGCTLKLYGGKGHFGAIADRRLALDVLEFANR